MHNAVKLSDLYQSCGWLFTFFNKFDQSGSTQAAARLTWCSVVSNDKLEDVRLCPDRPWDSQDHVCTIKSPRVWTGKFLLWFPSLSPSPMILMPPDGPGESEAFTPHVVPPDTLTEPIAWTLGLQNILDWVFWSTCRTWKEHRKCSEKLEEEVVTGSNPGSKPGSNHTQVGCRKET